MAQMDATYAKLLEIRRRTDLKMKSLRHLKSTFTDFSGNEQELKIRYYQVQGIIHLVSMKRFLLGDDTGLGKCASLSTLVATDAGLIPLGDFAPKGIKLLPDTFHLLDKPIQVWTGQKWVPVKRFYYNGVKPTKTVKTRRGYEITGSWVHPLWSRNEQGESFTRLGELRVGDFLCLVRGSETQFPTEEPPLPLPEVPSGSLVRTYPVPEFLNPDLSALLGYVVAEAWVNHTQRFSLTQDNLVNPEVHEDIRRLLLHQMGWSNDHHCMVRDTQIHVSSTYLRSYLLGLGVEMGVSGSKCVPWPIFRGTRESVRAFLRAFFDGEGSVNVDVIEVSSASERLLKEIQILLLRFGIVCSRSAKSVKGYEHNTYWRITICGEDARQFSTQIGFLTPRKQEALGNLFGKASNSNLDVVPHARPLVEALRTEIKEATTRHGANGLRKGSGVKQFGVSFEKTLSALRNSNRNPTFDFLRRMLEVSRSLGLQETEAHLNVESLCQSHLFYDPIEDITDGEEEVADIEVDDPSHSFVANGFVNHNTIQSIAALCYLWEVNQNQKAVILTTKSAAAQWVREFAKFTTGIKVILCRGTPSQREQARKLYEQATGPTVLVMGYRSAVQDFRLIQNWSDYVLVADEATIFKNPATQVHQVCRHLSQKACRVWALTATLIKNNLMEGFGIFQGVVVPNLFQMSGKPMNKNQFMMYFCITKMQPIPGGKQVPVITGYTSERIEEFKAFIDPYYIGRPKHEVATELPALVMQELEVDMTPLQEDKYAEAMQGLLEMGEGATARVQETTKLTAILYCQEIVNHLGLIDVDGESPKLEALIDLLTEGDLTGEKVIVYSRFKKFIDQIVPRLKKEKIKVVRITGDEGDKERDQAMQLFQNPDSGVQVVCLTAAGTESINLQAAKAIVCMDTPWSAGDFLQLIGRMIRIGSIHDRCYVIHLLARMRGAKPRTIDHEVMRVLSRKMTLVEAVLGKRLKGVDDQIEVVADNEISELFSALRDAARKEKA